MNILRLFKKPYKSFLFLLSSPILLGDFFSKETGREYGIGFFAKIKLVFEMVRNDLKIPTASFFMEHLMMATRIMQVPKNKEGAVIECGTYKGGSAANISLVCDLCQRQLHVFDSFEGLPEPEEYDRSHSVLRFEENHIYKKGGWRGQLEEVKRNIGKYGKLNTCVFHQGYFKDTLPDFKEKTVFIFLDVDLRKSLEECIRSLWVNLQDNCYLYTHEAPQLLIASLFFDKQWWAGLGFSPPGLIGAGTGLGLIPEANGFKSSLGYTIKNPRTESYKEVLQVGDVLNHNHNQERHVHHIYHAKTF